MKKVSVPDTKRVLTMKKIILKAFGKINLSLDILGKRQDGYHELSTLFRGIHLFDLISLEKKLDGLSVETDRKDLPKKQGNLAYEAASFMMERFPQITGVHIRIVKKIPVAAGLAGGSANAAAVLSGLNLLYGLGLSREKLERYGAHLGSDVAFCVHPMAALGKDRGERLTPVAPGPVLWMVLAKPPFGLATADVYQTYDRLDPQDILARPDAQGLILGMERQDTGQMYRCMGNVLEYAAFRMYPSLAQWSRDFRKLGAATVMMSGSGPTLTAFARDEEHARLLASNMRQPDWTVLLTRTLTADDLAKGMIFFGDPPIQDDMLEDQIAQNLDD